MIARHPKTLLLIAALAAAVAVMPLPGHVAGKAACVYLVYESADATPEFTAVRDDTAWKDSLDKAGIKWLAKDKDSLAQRLPHVVALAVKNGLPSVVAVDKDGRASVQPCPKTPEAMRQYVRSVGGES